MAFMKKVEGVSKVEVNQDEAREKFISGGGLVQADIINEEKPLPLPKEEWKNILIRVRADILDEINKLVSDRIGMTRTGWVLEAIQEKIKKEKQN